MNDEDNLIYELQASNPDVESTRMKQESESKGIERNWHRLIASGWNSAPLNDDVVGRPSN